MSLIQRESIMTEEKSICPECEDGWMVKVGGRLVCSHCGYEEEEPGEIS